MAGWFSHPGGRENGQAGAGAACPRPAALGRPVAELGVGFIPRSVRISAGAARRGLPLSLSLSLPAKPEFGDFFLKERPGGSFARLAAEGLLPGPWAPRVGVAGVWLPFSGELCGRTESCGLLRESRRSGGKRSQVGGGVGGASRFLSTISLVLGFVLFIFSRGREELRGVEVLKRVEVTGGTNAGKQTGLGGLPASEVFLLRAKQGGKKKEEKYCRLS